MSKSSFRVRKIVTLAILAALGSALMWVEIPFIPPFKFDISDTAVIIAMVLYGPIGGIAVALIKSLVHIIIISAGDFGVGEMIAFVASISYSLPFYYTMVLLRKSIKNPLLLSIIPCVIGTVFLTLFMFYFNIYVSFPLYSLATNTPFTKDEIITISSSFIPLNIIKGSGLSLVFLLLSFRLDYIATKYLCDEGECPLIINKSQVKGIK